jgi:large conductance mechanosensitive channel
MGMLSEFKAFVNKGNVLDLAVGVIIGAAFGKIVTALTDDLIMPIVGLFTGGINFSDKFIPLKTLPDGVTTLEAAKKAGVGVFAYGDFINAVINFIILAFVIFMIVRQANKMFNRSDDAATPEDVLLLREIRDNLKK